MALAENTSREKMVGLVPVAMVKRLQCGKVRENTRRKPIGRRIRYAD
jgi:hypothetical protein